MTTKITSILDLFNTFIIETFATKTKIPNPFDTASNNDNLLKNGYGIHLSSGSVSDLDYPQFVVYDRSLVVTLTKEIFRVQSDTDVLFDVQKTLLEEQNTLVTSLAKNRTFDNDIIRVEFSGDNGIEFIYGDKFNFLKLESTFVLSYREDKTYCYP